MRTAFPFKHFAQPRTVVIDHFHVEAVRRAARDRLADTPHAEDAERAAVDILPGEEIETPPGPLTGAHEAFGFGHPPRGRHKQRKTEVGGGLGQHVGGIGG